MKIDKNEFLILLFAVLCSALYNLFSIFLEVFITTSFAFSINFIILSKSISLKIDSIEVRNKSLSPSILINGLRHSV